MYISTTIFSSCTAFQVRELLRNSDETKPQEQSASGILDMIERFGKLKESGILTHEEFTEQKQKLLDKL
ncbi:hypothetical protein DRF65_24475 [Chryseobacterium pennae]|uniref:SHOCT domain-containing protein n=2 Tax=Chryseobacterium pennae TaxID=2258962 RepID=A0A3D9C2I9_9FLAO|nr:hypothetical protein DRF65_24475 [Chryseobacterium pennae]